MKGKVQKEYVISHIEKTLSLLRRKRAELDKATVKKAKIRLQRGDFFGLFNKVEEPSLHQCITKLDDIYKDSWSGWKSEYGRTEAYDCKQIKELANHSSEVWLTADDWHTITLHERILNEV